MLIMQEWTALNKQLADDGVGVGVTVNVVLVNDVVLDAIEGKRAEETLVLVAVDEPLMVLLLMGPVVALIKTSTGAH